MFRYFQTLPCGPQRNIIKQYDRSDILRFIVPFKVKIALFLSNTDIRIFDEVFHSTTVIYACITYGYTYVYMFLSGKLNVDVFPLLPLSRLADFTVKAVIRCALTEPEKLANTPANVCIPPFWDVSIERFVRLIRCRSVLMYNTFWRLNPLHLLYQR